MGRKAEFKATKSFTMGLQELGWLKEYSERKNEKASAIVNKLIRKAMLADNTEKVKDSNTQEAYCKNCNDWEPHFVDMVCTTCNKLNKELKARIDKKKKALKG